MKRSVAMSSAEHQKLPEINQSFWNLSFIQLAGIVSLPILTSSVLIFRQTNFASAFLTLLLGNGILWVIRLIIVQMSYSNRKSTLDISQDYFGKLGSYFIAILLIASSLAWFITQTTWASHALVDFLPLSEKGGINRFFQVSVILGILSTFLCLDGIVTLRRYATFAFPVLFIVLVALIFFSPSPSFPVENDTVGIVGLPFLLSTSIAISAEFPTFFRHSRSKRESLIALTVIQLISFVIGLAVFFLGNSLDLFLGIELDGIPSSQNLISNVLLIILMVLLVVSSNVANVYSASVGWELIAPKALTGRKEYLILGLGLTTVFICIANLVSLDFLLEFSDNSLINLCGLLVVAYSLKKIEDNRDPSFSRKVIYFLAWAIATILNNFIYIEYDPMLVGWGVIIFAVFFLIALKMFFKFIKSLF